MGIMQALFSAAIAAGFKVKNSVRLRKNANAYLSRTPTVAPTSSTVWTFSTWLKRGEIGTLQRLLSAGTAGADESDIQINASDQLQVYNSSASLDCQRLTTAVFRDPSAAYHIVIASNGATSIRLYANGVELTAFSGSWSALMLPLGDSTGQGCFKI